MLVDTFGDPARERFEIVRDFVEKLGNGSITPLQAKLFLSKDRESQVASWRDIYQREFGIMLPDEIEIPEHTLGSDRLIIVAGGITLSHVIGAFVNKFRVYLYMGDLDSGITQNERINTKTYAVWVEELVEAGPDLVSKSADDIKKLNLTTMTLLERLAYELIYFHETGKHLDVENTTLCAGSCYSDGSVPCVDWRRDRHKLYVGSCSPDDVDSRLRARAVVS